MDCDESQTLLHGYLDGELDVIHSLALAEHLQECLACAHTYEAQQELRTALRRSDLYHIPPPTFRKHWRTALRRASRVDRREPWWVRWGPPLGVALAAMLLLVWLATGRPRGLSRDDHMLQDVIAGHVRSLMVHHLTDITSSDRHTVKPWFEGSLDFSPPVPDLTTQGFPLIGGRLDYLDNRPVAALVYRRHQHAINLFIWPSTRDTPRQQHVTRQGYNLIAWTTADLTCWTISTLNMAELKTFVSMATPGQ